MTSCTAEPVASPTSRVTSERPDLTRSRCCSARQEPNICGPGRDGALPSEGMRATTFVVFLRFIGAAGVGASLGASVAGLIAVLTGRALGPGSPWLTALPVLVVLGALVGTSVAWLTRFWLLPAVARRRAGWGALAGAVVVPLTIAIGQLGTLSAVGTLLMLAGAATTAVVWVRWTRATYATPGARPRMNAVRPQLVPRPR